MQLESVETETISRIIIWEIDSGFTFDSRRTFEKRSRRNWNLQRTAELKLYFFLFIFQRRISREGVLNEAGGSMGSEVTAIDLDESMHQLSRGTGNDGSSDPLLQIPTQLSAVLTMKRGSPKHRRSQSKQINTTPLLKRKRESIVWSSSSWERRNPKFCTTTLSYGRETIQIDTLKYKTTKVHYNIYFLSKDRHTKGCVNH